MREAPRFRQIENNSPEMSAYIYAKAKTLDNLNSALPTFREFTPLVNVKRAGETLSVIQPLLVKNPSLISTLNRKSTDGQITMLIIPSYPLILADTGERSNYITATAPVLTGTRKAIEQATASLPSPQENPYFLTASHGNLDTTLIKHMEESSGPFSFNPKTMNPSDFIALAVTTFINEPFQLYFKKYIPRFIPHRFLGINKDYATNTFIESVTLFEKQRKAPQKDVAKQNLSPANDALEVFSSDTDRSVSGEEGSDALPNATVIFTKDALYDPEIYKARYKRLVTLPRARESFIRARLRNNANLGNIQINMTGVSAKTLEAFEKGKINIELNKILTGLKACIDLKDPDILNLETMARDEEWVKALTKEGITIGWAVTLMRLDLLMDKRTFAKKAKVSDREVMDIENGILNPLTSEVNLLIVASRLDPLGIPAQIIRLLREKRFPMELKELESCNFGRFFDYMRILKGHSSVDAAKLAKVGKSTIVRMNRDQRKLKEATKSKLLTYLDLDPESVLEKIARIKIDEDPKYPQPIPHELIQQVISGEKDGRHLFAEMLEDADPSKKRGKEIIETLESKKRTLIRQGEQAKICGVLLKYLREKKSLSLRVLGQRSSLAHEFITKKETNEGIPEDFSVIKILHGMGYDIFNPVTLYFLELLKILKQAQS